MLYRFRTVVKNFALNQLKSGLFLADLEKGNRTVFHTIYSSSECRKLGFNFYSAYTFFKNLFLTSHSCTISKSCKSECDLLFIELKPSNNINTSQIVVYILLTPYLIFQEISAMLLFTHSNIV